MINTRIEHDSIGSMAVPADAYYGIQSQRGIRNFQISGQKMHPLFIRNLAIIKKACAIVNQHAGTLSERKATAIIKACNYVCDHSMAKEFLLDPIQGGAGTSANMNMNEVIANLSNQFLGYPLGSYEEIHPNDDVNMGQSTNDTIPTAGKLTVLALAAPLLHELKRLETTLHDKGIEFRDIVKMGRTQLQDAVPMTLGDSFFAYASMVRRCHNRIQASLQEMYEVNLGGTAIGSGMNTSDYYFDHIVPMLSELTSVPLRSSDNLYDSTENLDSFVSVSGALKSCAISLSKMCNDFRLLSSGPRCGLHEINLPAKQNGSSIMPGKVNPVIPEVVSQVAFLVAGHDTTITLAAEAGQMELNAFEPVLFHQLFESITCMTNAVKTLTDNCVNGITVNAKHCSDLVESSTGICTALAPVLGYQKAAEIAKNALRRNTSIRVEALRSGLIEEGELDELLDIKKSLRKDPIFVPKAI